MFTLLALSLTLATPAPALPPCRLQVIPDYTFVVAYKAVLRLSPDCTPGAALRVRKSSTLNTVRHGAPYQPYQGPWDLSWVKSKTTVPNDKLWTSTNWRWEYFDPATLNPRTGAKGVWRGAEVLRAARNPQFWDGVAWGWRLILVVGHLAFMAFALIRQNAPLLFSSYSAFDDALPFVCWAAWSVLAAVLLLALPPRVPFGLISTLFSSFLYFLMAGLFSVGAGLVFISLICYLFGSVGLLLFARALWLYMVRVTWFQDRIMRRSPSHGR